MNIPDTLAKKMILLENALFPTFQILKPLSKSYSEISYLWYNYIRSSKNDKRLGSYIILTAKLILRESIWNKTKWKNAVQDVIKVTESEKKNK